MGGGSQVRFWEDDWNEDGKCFEIALLYSDSSKRAFFKSFFGRGQNIVWCPCSEETFKIGSLMNT